MFCILFGSYESDSRAVLLFKLIITKWFSTIIPNYTRVSKEYLTEILEQ